MSIKRANASSVTKSGAGISDVPDAPTGLSATDSGDGTTASVSFTPAVTGGTPTSYTVTSSPGSFTGTGASSPISVTGLSSGVAYTFTATATNSTGTSGASSASSSLTLASVGSYFLIERVTAGAGGSSSITFSSIPSTYTHLQIRFIARLAAAYQDSALYMQLNSDTGGNYSNHILYGDGGSAAVTGATSNTQIEFAQMIGNSNTADVYSGGVIDILDYTNTNKYTVIRSLDGYDKNGATDPGYIKFTSGSWRNTAAVTTIKLYNPGSNFKQYSTFALYGIKGA